MSSNRITRVNELLRREIAEALFRVLSDREADMASITVTHVSTSSNLRSARVFVSVRADEDSQERIMSRLRRHRHEIQQMINRDLKLKYTPRLMFELDHSVERGHHVLDILDEIEKAQEEEPDPAVEEEQEDQEEPGGHRA